MARYDYPALAEEAILDLLAAEAACVWSEVQAKIADRLYPGLPTRINPHHLTAARARLLASGRILNTERPTRGGHSVGTLSLVTGARDKTRVERASARKSSLMASFEGWAATSRRARRGLIGQAGEDAVHTALTAAAPYGLRLVNPSGGEVSIVAGHAVPGGPLDNAAWVTSLAADGRPMPTVVLCPVEVKNVRHWLYPASREVYQVLYKAAVLQQAEPGLAIAPVLVCRERQYTLDQMSRQLGFRVFNARKQFLIVNHTVQPSILEAVRTELGFVDLTALEDDADPGLTRAFERLANEVPGLAQTWSTVGAQFADLYDTLRSSSISPGRRVAAEDELKRRVAELVGATSVGW